jgi:fatty-acyl-CoA synthase
VVPTMLARIVSVLEGDPGRRPPALRSLAYGGARMPAPVLERALELLPDVDFVNAYGLTETSSTVAVLGPDDHRAAFTSDDPVVRRRLESCGRAVPGVEFRIVDGEVWIRGDQVGGGYVGTESQVDAEGWLHTGDQGLLDDEGYLFVLGRGDDVIIRGGENISPTEIEDTLMRYPTVAAAAVVGLPDAEWGEKVAAMVVLRSADEALDQHELREWSRRELGSIKAPEVVIVADDLPQTPTGKVLRREVRERLRESTAGE